MNVPYWVQALLFGLLSALSLPLGAWLGIHLSPVSHSVTAKWMAFGAGSLVYAVATQMYGMAVFSLVLASPMKPYPQPCKELCRELFVDVSVECASGLVGAGIFVGLGKFMTWLSEPPPRPAHVESELAEQQRPTTPRPSLSLMTQRPSIGPIILDSCPPIAALRPFRTESPPNSPRTLELHRLTPAQDPNDDDDSNGGRVAFAIWLGMLLDGIPESIMMGFLTNEGDITMAFVLAIFVANFPEAFSGASLLRRQGMKPWKIHAMWLTIFLLTGILAACGSFMLPQSHDKAVIRIENLSDSIAEGIAGGMMLAMVATAMLPEAYKGAGDKAGVYFVFGFVSALSITCLEARFGTVQNARPPRRPNATSLRANLHRFH